MPDALNVPNELLDLQRASDDARAKLADLAGDEWDAQWRAWREAATRAQAAITQHAKTGQKNPEGLNRAALEAAVKRAVRHPDAGVDA